MSYRSEKTTSWSTASKRYVSTAPPPADASAASIRARSKPATPTPIGADAAVYLRWIWRARKRRKSADAICWYSIASRQKSRFSMLASSAQNRLKHWSSARSVKISSSVSGPSPWSAIRAMARRNWVMPPDAMAPSGLRFYNSGRCVAQQGSDVGVSRRSCNSS